MAFPKLLQKLFQNNGAGDKLRSEILPDMNYLPTSGGTVSGDITLNGSLLGIVKADKNGSLAISGGNRLSSGGAGSAILWLGGGDDSSGFNGPGGFSLEASKGTWGQSDFLSYELRGNPDGTLSWGGKPVLCGESGGFPVGFIALYSGNNVPNGWFRCDGSTIADMATNYPKLYAVLGTNVLPNYSDRYPVGASDGINSSIEAGLPNLSGRVQVSAGHEPGTYAGFPVYADGCLHGGTSSFGTTRFVASGIDKQEDASHKTTLFFDAARSNSLYGLSSTVRPSSVKVAVLIKHD